MASVSGERETENSTLSDGTETGGDQIAAYLEELRRQLARGRVRPSSGQASVILAETEDHLREAAAASVASGMTEQVAQCAAIEAFGKAQTVARSHRPRARAVLARLGIAAVPLAGAYLLLAGAVGTTLLQFDWHGGLPAGRAHTLRDMSPTLAPDFRADPWLIGCAIAGFAVLVAYTVVRRRQRASAGSVRAVRLPGFFFPLAAVALVLFAAAELVGIVRISGASRIAGGDYYLGAGTVLGALLMALACAAWSVLLLARSAARLLRLAS